MKATGQCPKCVGGKIGRAKSILDSEHHEVHLGEGRDGPLWGLIGKKHRLKLEAYVCTKCGYAETYIKNHDGIKWEAIKNFEWVESSGKDDESASSSPEKKQTEPPSADQPSESSDSVAVQNATKEDSK